MLLFETRGETLGIPLIVIAQSLDGKWKEIISLQQKHSLEKNQGHLNKVHRVLVEGVSKKSENHLYGRNTQNAVVVFPKENHKAGDYVDIFVKNCTSATLLGESISN